MRIAYISKDNPRDPITFSGISYYLAKSLEKQSISLDYIGPLIENYSLSLKIKSQLYRYFLKKNYLPWTEPQCLMDLAFQVSQKLSDLDSDIIFSLGTMPIAYLESTKPIVYSWDCTFAGLLDAYPCFLNLSQESIKNGLKMEQMALEKCSLSIFPSEWAVQTVLDNYHVDSSKIKVVPYGANLSCKLNIEEVKTMISSRSTKNCDLLFLGIDWHRKGGETAYKVAKELNKSGLKTTLTIVGCNPNFAEPIPDYITVLGFINKFTKHGLETIKKLLSKSHFLILPSAAENYGIVFCEASSFGTPSLASKVGGIPTAIKDGFNGHLFSKNASYLDYCDYIFDIFMNYNRYIELALSSFNEYQSRLNWSTAGKVIKDLLYEV